MISLNQKKCPAIVTFFIFESIPIKIKPMLKNFFVVTLRNLRKNPLYSAINISGLAIGIVCSILILLWVADETSYDDFHSNKDQLYQVWVHADYDNKRNTWRSVPLPLYEALKTESANIKNTAVLGWGSNHLLTVGDKILTREGYWASEEFLDMFQFDLIKGDRSLVLDDPSSIVISQSVANALFGDEDPINKIVKIDNASELKVTGVLAEIPSNSSFQFEFLLPWKHRRQINDWVIDNEDNWGNYSFQVFVELDDKNNASAVDTKIKDLLARNGQTDMHRELMIYPMERWRLYSTFENGKEKGGINDFVQLFSIIAIFILIIACINFMNLATARSERRAKEVGIRKSVGSSKRELVLQFLGESLIIAMIAFIIAILAAQLLLPFYNNLVDKKLFIDYLSPTFWLLSILFIVVTGLISGSYPAFFLSSFRPVTVLKGKVKLGKNASLPRKILVGFQFFVAIFLMIGMTVILQQINLVKGRSLGYDQNGLITIENNEDLNKHYDAIKLELINSGAAVAMTRSNSPITNIYSNNFLGWPGKPEDQRVIFTTVATEYDYTKTMGIKVIEGRDFSEEFKSDSTAILVNKAAMELMQLENPIGTSLDLWGEKRTLIGIIDDVLMGSLYREVKPMFLIMDRDWTSALTVRLPEKGDLQENLNKVGEVFKKYNPAYPFEYSFVDVEFQKKFVNIRMRSKLASLFALLAMLITGLGLFGLAAYTAEQRTKEIGIRKVLGASISSLITLVSKDFSKLVVIAFLISSPVAWWLLTIYLERYPIRVDIPWWIFPAAGLVALVFALLIVTNQAIRVARANPVKSLKDD